jgi:hypothetical protein
MAHLDDNRKSGLRVAALMCSQYGKQVWVLVLVLVLSDTVRFGDSPIQNSERIGAEKDTRARNADSNVSNGSNRALITTWSGLGGSLRQGRAGWRATTWYESDYEQGTVLPKPNQDPRHRSGSLAPSSH